MPVPQDEDGGANARAFRTHRGGGEDGDWFQIRRLWRMRKAPARVAAGVDFGKHDVITDPQGGNLLFLRLATKRQQCLTGSHRAWRGEMTANLHRRTPALYSRAPLPPVPTHAIH